MKTDIRDSADIRILVDSFYQRAGKDELLGPIFSRIGKTDPGKEALYQYWSSALLNQSVGDQHQFPRHIEQMFSRQHFIRWLSLFLETINTLYAGSVAEKAKVMVIRKSEEFQSRLELRSF
jgi:hemoglobin